MHSGLPVLLLFCCMLAANCKNFIINGDISIPNVTKANPVAIIPGGTIGWTANMLEVGLSSNYNSGLWANLPVMNLDVNPNQLISQFLFLPNVGRYILSFVWAPTENFIASSQGQVRWNGKVVLTMNPKSSLVNIERIRLIGKAGVNLISFEGIGPSDGHGAVVTKIQITHANMIINSELKYPPSSPFAQYQGGIVGWVGNTVELGANSNYNLNLGPGQALNSFVNNAAQTYTTSVYCAQPNRDYNIVFRWAALTGTDLTTVQWQVLWNNQILKTAIPTSYASSLETIPVRAMQGLNTLSLQGLPRGSNVGAVFTNIQLIEKN